jgi:D-alanine-D-alanine ligase
MSPLLLLALSPLVVQQAEAGQTGNLRGEVLDDAGLPVPGARLALSGPGIAGEIVVTGREFYDFEAKYLGAAGIDLVCPADLTAAELAELQALSIRAFEALGAAGLARVDFFLTETGFVLNEINTMPGFTPISMFPRCWQETGLGYSDLITELIEVALAHRG